MDYWLVLALIVSTIIFYFVMMEHAEIDRCPYRGGKCFDGNGKYQYKGRGCENESVSRLLSRIDWLAKNSTNKPIYTTSYIIAYALTLGVLIILYATSYYTLNVWEYIIILLISFIIVFSITNLINFHSDRYPIYYIRENISLISDKLKTEIRNPPKPCKDTYVPHRTTLRDKLS